MGNSKVSQERAQSKDQPICCQGPGRHNQQSRTAGTQPSAQLCSRDKVQKPRPDHDGGEAGSSFLFSLQKPCFYLLFLKFVCICARWVSEYAYMSAGVHRRQKRQVIPPELSSVDAGNHIASSVRAASVLNHCTIISARRTSLF